MSANKTVTACSQVTYPRINGKIQSGSVYIVQCGDGTYYTGYTNDLKHRIALHNSGNGARYLKNRLPVKLVYAKEYRYYRNALRRERGIKKLTRRQKERLIENYERGRKHDEKVSAVPTDLQSQI